MRLSRICAYHHIIHITLASGIIVGTAAFVARADSPKEGEIVRQVVDAWKQQEERIHAFEYSCSLEKSVVQSSPGKSADPFAVSSSSNGEGQESVVELQSSFTLAFSEGCMVYTQSGMERDPITDAPGEQNVTASFAEGEQRCVMRSPTSPFGIGELAYTKSAGDTFWANMVLIPLWLSYSPSTVLERIGYGVVGMTASSLPESHEGHDCWRMQLSTRLVGRSVYLLADPAYAFLPVRLVEEQDGHRISDLAIEYCEDNCGGWRVAGWERTRFGNTGNVIETRIGKVTDCRINEPLSSEVVTLEYPVGTHVKEQGGDTEKFFIALANGDRRYISRDEFGMLPPAPVDKSKGGVRSKIGSGGYRGPYVAFAAGCVCETEEERGLSSCEGCVAGPQ